MSSSFGSPGDGDRPNEYTSKREDHFGILLHYTITELFGAYSHNFNLAGREPTILTGANGTGKSTILRTISLISRGDWTALSAIRFEQIRLEFESARLTVGRKKDGALSLRLDRPSARPKVWQHSPEPESLRREHEEIVTRLLAEDFIRDFSTFEEASGRERSIRNYLAHTKGANQPGWVEEIPKCFPTLLVSDQRLAPGRKTRPRKRGAGEVIEVISAIETAVQHINEEVQHYKLLYGTASQNLDRDFPRRVFTAIGSPGPFASPSQIARDFQQVQHLRASLAATGLIDATEVEESIYDLPLENPDSRSLISTYLTDTKEKLATFEPLRRRLEPFMAFLRRHYRDKVVGIDAQHGFRIFSEKTGEEIDPVQLSSGEQQMFILSHKLLFESSPGTLVMIDEPELSLHVLWQSTFVDDLTEISAVSGTYFMLATHSPTLIAGRNDLRRSLDR
ncbi:AAA family ATPase [Streptomyces gardneri]|uniref:AAA family ATPase n=1 Tax=Streptomyces gardneri TaxID=66892 RepID=UPI0033C1235E